MHHLHDPYQSMVSILDTMVDGIITINVDGIILAFNRAAERIFGYSADETMGHSVTMLMPPGIAEQHSAYVRAYLATGQAKVIGIGREVEGMRKDGSRFPMDLAISETNNAGRFFFTGIVRDITERRRMEEALRDERNLLSAILDTVAALIVVLDADGKVVRFNPSCERVTGFSFDDVKGKSMGEVLIPGDARVALESEFARLVEGAETSTYENEWLTRDGGRRLIAWSNTVLRDVDGAVTHIIGTGIDITELRRAEEAIVSVSEAERRLIGQDLHDVLGQQLTGLTLLSKSLARRLAQGFPEAAQDALDLTELAREAVTEARRLAHGLYPTGIDRVGLPDSLSEMADTFRRIYRIDCQYTGLDDEDCVEQGARMHLYRIAQESVNNAIKHSKSRDIQIALSREDGHITLSIRDAGIGIPVDVPRGEGMGLSIMKYRAKMIGATFDILRPDSGGTVIRCSLPHVQSGILDS